VTADHPLDFAAIKAEHTGDHWCSNRWWGPGHSQPCLPYRLAMEAERLAGKVARVEAVLRPWEAAQVNVLRAALADPPKQECTTPN
jgi:hypothetical protein